VATDTTTEDTTEDTAGDTGEGGPAAEPALGYEEAREELDSVVRRLESGGLTLKESLALWERGEELARVCEQWLEGARARLAAAVEDAGNDPDAPF
jgi:exodeoxyribonuclease VII small subunit